MRASTSAALIGLVMLAVACTRATADPSVTPMATASTRSSAASASVTLADAAAPAFVAWTDDAATAQIVKDCHAKAPNRGPLQPGEHDPLLCQLPWRQSCSYNPCRQKGDECRSACGSTCRACDDSCGSTCDSCRSACKDDACRADCAKKTGVCKQSCLTAIDRCGSAECTAAGSTCWEEEKQKWKSHGCSCAKIRPCTQKCVDAAGKCAGEEDCFGKCKSACAARFPGCDVLYCIMGNEPSGD